MRVGCAACKRRVGQFLSRAAAFLLGMGIVCAAGSAVAQFRAVNEVTGTSDGAVATNSTDMAAGTNAMATGGLSTAVGNGATASAGNATALGNGATASGDLSTALGQAAISSGNFSTAVGVSASASGLSSTAIGLNANASGNSSTALGLNANASGNSSLAVGTVAIASGNSSTALGASSVASGNNSLALGRSSTAAFLNSTAIGSGAASTRDNQVMIGTAANTYTAPGITSAASKAAQSGPLEVVTTDAGGNLASQPFSSLGLASVGQVERNTEGVAMAMALSGIPTILPDGTTFGISTSYGNYGGENGMAVGGSMRIIDNLFVNGGSAFGMGGRGNSGARLGATFAW